MDALRQRVPQLVDPDVVVVAPVVALQHPLLRGWGSVWIRALASYGCVLDWPTDNASSSARWRISSINQFPVATCIQIHGLRIHVVGTRILIESQLVAPTSAEVKL